MRKMTPIPDLTKTHKKKKKNPADTMLASSCV